MSKAIIAQDAPAEALKTNRLSNTNQTILHEQEQQNKTTPKYKKRVLYFAYGSNLSPSQMRLRCEHSPSTSGRPLALARLDHWRWLICERGYANVIPPTEWRVSRQVGYADLVPESSTPSSSSSSSSPSESHEDKAVIEEGREKKDVVFGILYEMTPQDEYLLDGYEGVDHSAPQSVFARQIPLDVRPREQENGAYNKWYVPARVVKWFDDAEEEEEEEEDVTALVYVDEKRVSLGPPKLEYIARMNRAIAESMVLGVPRDWVQSVMRRAIPEEKPAKQY
jgi:hypothetical protein